MKKSSLKLYFATLIFTLALASFTFAGEVHFPIAPPPPNPDGDDRMSAPAVITTVSEENGSTMLKTIWDFLAQSTNLFHPKN